MIVIWQDRGGYGGVCEPVQACKSKTRGAIKRAGLFEVVIGHGSFLISLLGSNQKGANVFDTDRFAVAG